MKNKKKAVWIVALLLVVSWICYLTVDCIRLNHSVPGTKPLITIGEKVEDHEIIYDGLGYRIDYYVDIEPEADAEWTAHIEQYGYGAEFWLFGKILLWAWVS